MYSFLEAVAVAVGSAVGFVCGYTYGTLECLYREGALIVQKYVLIIRILACGYGIDL